MQTHLHKEEVNLLEREITTFANTLKEVIPHPKPRYHILKSYVDCLVKKKASLEQKIRETPIESYAIKALLKKLPGKKMLYKHLPAGSEALAPALATVLAFNRFFCQATIPDTLLSEWCNKASLFLQVEVVKASRELKVLNDDESDIHFIKQGQNLTEESDASGEEGQEEEKIAEVSDNLPDVPEESILPPEVLSWVKTLRQTTQETEQTRESIRDRLKKEPVKKDTDAPAKAATEPEKSSRQTAKESKPDSGRSY